MTDTDTIKLFPRAADAPRFAGYRRAGGVGTRNAIGVLSLAPAAATVAEAVCARAGGDLVRLAWRGEPGPALHRTLEGFASHPNFGGVLIIDADGEGVTLRSDPRRTRRLDVVHAGGTLNAIDQALAHLEVLARQAADDRREVVQARELVLGLHGDVDHPAVALAVRQLREAGARVILGGTGPAAATGLVATGATVLAYATARGSAFGCRPAPCLKLALATELYQRMAGDMDVDCGAVDVGLPAAMVADGVIQALMAVASGEPTRAEAAGHADHDFLP